MANSGATVPTGQPEGKESLHTRHPSGKPPPCKDSCSWEDQSWFTLIAPHEVVELVRRNRGQVRSHLDDEELLQAADRRLRERLCEALAGLGKTLRLAEPAG